MNKKDNYRYFVERNFTAEQKEMYYVYSQKMPYMYIHKKDASPNIPIAMEVKSVDAEFVLKKGYFNASLFDEENSLNIMKNRPGLERIKIKELLGLD